MWRLENVSPMGKKLLTDWWDGVECAALSVLRQRRREKASGRSGFFALEKSFTGMLTSFDFAVE